MAYEAETSGSNAYPSHLSMHRGGDWIDGHMAAAGNGNPEKNLAEGHAKLSTRSQASLRRAHVARPVVVLSNE